jgi:hypothetical protein
MDTKNTGLKKLPAGLAALSCAVALAAISCSLPEGPAVRAGTGPAAEPGAGTLTLVLPGTKTSAPSRAVLNDDFIAALQYQVTMANSSGETVALEIGGGGITVSLTAGLWTIAVTAYDPAFPNIPVGSGSASVTITAGQNVSQKIIMSFDPGYGGPFYIHNETELRLIGAAGGLAISNSGRVFYLENDIILFQPWTPIGDSGDPFKAIFDGQGHTITVTNFEGVKEDGNTAYLGFFAHSENAQIKNLTINYGLSAAVDTGNSANAYAGGVAGYANSTTFENVSVKGDFSAVSSAATCELSVGGIVGKADGSAITKSSFIGVVDGTSTDKCYTGGIAGALMDGEITASYVTGRVSGQGWDTYAGGIVGTSGGGIAIERCYAWAAVEAQGDGVVDVGGIAGSTAASLTTPLPLVSACYARGTVTGSGTALSKSAGGIVGSFLGIIEKCAVLNDSVSFAGATDIGEVAGNKGAISPSSNIQNNYTASDISLSPGSSNNWAGTSTPRADFTGPPAGTVYGLGALDWDFSDGTGDWKWIGSYGYPVLSWQEVPPADPTL